MESKESNIPSDLNQDSNTLDQQQKTNPKNPLHIFLKNKIAVTFIVILLAFGSLSILIFFLLRNNAIFKDQPASGSKETLTEDSSLDSNYAYGLIYEYEKYERGLGAFEKKSYYVNPDGSGLKVIKNFSQSEISEEGFTFIEEYRSPNTIYIAREDAGQKLEIINEQTEEEILVKELSEDEGSVYFGLWSRDSSFLIYEIFEDIPGTGIFGENRISFYSINSDGSDKKFLGSHEGAESIVLGEINLDKNELYWIETGEGGYRRNFTIYDIKDKKIKSVRDKVPNDSALLISNNYDKVYTSGKGKIFEYDIKSDTNKLLYEFKDNGVDEYGNPSFMQSSFSNNKNKVYITERYEPGEDVINYALDLTTGKLDKLFDGYEVDVRSISPDDRYIIYDSIIRNAGKDLGSIYAYDTQNKKLKVLIQYKASGVGHECEICEDVTKIEWAKRQ